MEIPAASRSWAEKVDDVAGPLGVGLVVAGPGRECKTLSAGQYPLVPFGKYTH